MIPSFPKFASAWSLMQARATLDGRVGGNAQQLALYGKRLLERPVFGGNLKKLSEAYLHLVAPHELLREHTVFGTFGKLLGAELETAAFAHVAETGSFEIRRFFPGERHGSLLTTASRWCPRCVNDDQIRFGFSFWRVHHHLPGIKHCLIHGDPLVQSCIGKSCRSTPMTLFELLPGDSCTCSQPEKLTPEDSIGYRVYAALMRRLTVDPNYRLDPLQRLGANVRSASEAQRATQQLLDNWNCPNALALSQRLECTVSETQLARLSKGQELGCHPALLVAMAALHEEDDMAATGSLEGHEALNLTANDLAVVRATAARFGFPTSGAMLLLKGESITSLEMRHAISTADRARSFVALLPPQIRHRIALAEAALRQEKARQTRDARTAQHRERAEALLVKGVNTRKALNLRAGATYTWLLMSDRDWLDEHFPKIDLHRLPKAR